MYKGIDVSHHDSPDFFKVKESGVSFVYIKATEGTDYRDPMYQPHAFNGMKAGLPVGFYHFARPDQNECPKKEAENFIEAISVFKYQLLPVLDLEVETNLSDDDLYLWAKCFIDRVQLKTGHQVMLYTGLHYLESHPTLKKLQVPLWIAAYRPVEPPVPWTVWQYSECENVPGVGKCDANWAKNLKDIQIHKDIPDLKRYLKLTHPYMRGEDVKLLQERLNIPADGIFGPQTEQAVKNWQRVHDEYGNVVPPGKGLDVDGIVGPKTWKSLFA